MCSIEGCNRKYHAKEFCNTHYLRWKKFGNPLYIIDPKETGKKISIANKGRPSPNKGKKTSDETKKKISDELTGRFVGEKHPMWGKHHTSNSKQKTSDKLKGMFAGDKHPMWGKHHTSNSKQKIAEASKGRKHTDYSKKKMSDAKKGKPRPDLLGKSLSQKTKNKISKSNTGKQFSAEHKKNLSKAMMGRTSPRKGVSVSDAQKRKQSEKMKGKPSPMKGKKQSDEARKKMSEKATGRPSSRKGVPHTKEANEKNRQKHLGKHPSEATRKKMSTSQNKPETLEKNRERRYNQEPTTESRNEILVQTYLKENNIYFQKQFKFKINGRIVCKPDLLISPNKIIQVYGDYYHANPNHYAPDDVIKGYRNKSIRAGDIQKKDTRENELMKKQGYEILILWENEFGSRQKPKITHNVREKISEFLKK